MALQVGEILFIAFIALMLFFSVTANLLVVVIVARNVKMRNVTNVCICNLAISDILLAAFVLPQNLHDISHTENYFEGDMLCRIVNFFPLFCIMVSIYSMVTISFERRRAIVLSVDQNPMKVIKVVLPALWLGSFAICIPTIIEYNEFLSVNPLNNKSEWKCGSMQSNAFSQTNAFMLIGMAYIIPLFLVVINYIVIIKFIWKKCKLDGATNQRCLMVKKKLQIIKMMVLAAAFFAIAWAPYFTLLAIGKITGHDGAEDSGGALNLIRLSLSAFSTAYNVFLYVIYNKNFRDGFKALCTACYVAPGNTVVPAVMRPYQIPAVACNKQHGGQ